ncbi:hypothetical protein PUV54_07505 [Hyphococcus flavus]|uniref:Uncharacterized protein n=1 Tax=Hyphococcus flavus TaxID=1866326 RepID=A0AAE9ZDK8_9PROT|nr:hypothetical protein [Hyphococcus flavus]WDI33039.1 hypothetical protein PUV54_07505 [Hyphococcus flavus]
MIAKTTISALKRMFYWSRNGERVAAVQMEYKAHALVLDSKVRNRGGEWRPGREEIPFARTAKNFGGARH